MRLLDRLKGEERVISTQSMPWGAWQGEQLLPSWAGVSVTTQTAMQLLAVYGCVQRITNAIATLPLDVFRKEASGTRTNVTPPAWLITPTVGMSRTAWLSQILTSLLLEGNAYISVKRSPDTGAIVELVAIAPSVVDVRRENGQVALYVNGRIPQGEVLHIPALILAGTDVGMSPLEAARQSIGLGLAAQEYGARFFGQGATQTGVIEYPNDLPPGEAEQLAKQWTKKHGSKEKAHLPGVLANGAHWVSTGVTNEQAQFLETRGFTAAEIAGQMFLLDPTEIGVASHGSSVTYANLQERNQRTIQVALLPWIVRIEDALSGLLAQPRYVKFNLDGLLRGDQETRFKGYGIGVNHHFLLPNEAREFEDLPPIDGGDKFPAAPSPAGFTPA